MGHARALLSVGDEKAQRRIAGLVERDGISVREVERLARREKDGGRPPTPPPSRPVKSAYVLDLERRLRERFATKTRIDGSRTKGKVAIEYYSMDELSRILEILLPE
jgi:ParB family chromosome partitioning protein